MRSVFVLSALALLPGALSTKSSKRGLVYVDTQHTDDQSVWTTGDLTWYYNYGSSPTASYAAFPQLEFVPMLWGAPSDPKSTSFLDDVRSQIKRGANIKYVLGFNEPDGTASTGGSNVTPGLAASTWIREIEPLKDLGVKLGAPAVTGAPSGLAWLKAFFTACAGNCTVDFIPVHWYDNFEGLASHIGEVMYNFPNQTVWVTEYAYANKPLKDTQSFFNTSAEYMDRVENITRYSYFGSFRSSASNVGPNAAMLTQDGKLTDIGSFYLGFGPTGNIPSANIGEKIRIPGGSSTIVGLAGFFCLWSVL
ncbi:MAG: hypothetical protein M1829_005516 [Trizodia sp. TS-e1964]|nr:MAG: hypothetical protein M1829_005516 [Trizodia sp. TS-e1964]